MLMLDRIDICQFIYFYSKKLLTFVINCLKSNRVTICRAKCYGIVTLKVLPASGFLYTLEGKRTKNRIPKMKLNRNDTSFSMQSVKENVKKVSRK